MKSPNRIIFRACRINLMYDIKIFVIILYIDKCLIDVMKSVLILEIYCESDLTLFLLYRNIYPRFFLSFVTDFIINAKKKTTS